MLARQSLTSSTFFPLQIFLVFLNIQVVIKCTFTDYWSQTGNLTYFIRLVSISDVWYYDHFYRQSENVPDYSGLEYALLTS